MNRTDPGSLFVVFLRQRYTYDLLIDHPTNITTTMTRPQYLKQIKSYWYYVFWSIATLAVVLGQIYVGTGYRSLAEALKLSLIQSV